MFDFGFSPLAVEPAPVHTTVGLVCTRLFHASRGPFLPRKAVILQL